MLTNNYYNDFGGSTATAANMSNPWYPPPGSSYNFIMDHPPSNSREMRNRAEKMRRDKLNAFIGELASLVPMVARSSKRMDKTSILRLTATHLRIYQTLMNGKSKPWTDMPKQINQFILEQLVCEQLGGFLLILTPAGKIVFISHTVENLLGHLQTDLMGQSILSITSPDDHDRLKMYIGIDSKNIGHEWRKYFNIRLKRAGPRTESAVYEPVRIIGVHRQFDDNNCNNQNNSSSSSSVSSTSSTVSTTNNNGVLLLFVRIIKPEPLSERLLEASKDEYMTRHWIDGRIINSDQRISLIAGYMTEEVSGMSAFKFMHRDDVRWVMIALRQMYDRGESKGSSCYRLLSRNGQFIYLRTFGFLEIDDTGTVETFVCINTLVTEKEGRHLINEMKRKFSAIIYSLPPPISPVDTDTDSVQSVEDPHKVEQAIVHLITNLPSPGSDHRSTPSPRVYNVNESQDCSSSSSTTENSPNKPYHVKLKTGPKRPPSTDILEATLQKRQKMANSNNCISTTTTTTSIASPQHQQQQIPLPSLSPYHLQKRSQLAEISPEQPPLYQQQHDQMVKNV